MTNDNEQAKAAHPLRWNVPNINDLRSAIEYLKKFKGQYIETDRSVDPKAELAGVGRMPEFDLRSLQDPAPQQTCCEMGG